MLFDVCPQFEKDFKKLEKKYKTLKDDFVTLKKFLTATKHPNNYSSFRIDNLGVSEIVIKLKHIPCRSLKGKGSRTGLRITYAYFEKEDRILFIEFYQKSEKANEDRKRIKEVLAQYR